MWYRVFGTSDTEPSPAGLLEHLGEGVTGNFRGDDAGWFRAELSIEPGARPLELERFLVSEEDLRGELNTWAAWVEGTGDGPVQIRLMQHLIGTRQLFTIRPVNERATEPCEALCRFLARHTNGVYQVDGQGFFEPDGQLLLEEGSP
jgi:hypothetical protein